MWWEGKATMWRCHLYRHYPMDKCSIPLMDLGEEGEKDILDHSAHLLQFSFLSSLLIKTLCCSTSAVSNSLQSALGGNCEERLSICSKVAALLGLSFLGRHLSPEGHLVVLKRHIFHNGIAQELTPYQLDSLGNLKVLLSR